MKKLSEKKEGAKFAFIMPWGNLENALEELKEVFLTTGTVFLRKEERKKTEGFDAN